MGRERRPRWDDHRSGKSGFHVKTEILIGKEKPKNPGPHQIKIIFDSSNNITTNTVFTISKNQWYGKKNENMKSSSSPNPTVSHKWKRLSHKWRSWLYIHDSWPLCQWCTLHILWKEDWEMHSLAGVKTMFNLLTRSRSSQFERRILLKVTLEAFCVVNSQSSNREGLASWWYWLDESIRDCRVNQSWTYDIKEISYCTIFTIDSRNQ